MKKQKGAKLYKMPLSLSEKHLISILILKLSNLSTQQKNGLKEPKKRFNMKMTKKEKEICEQILTKYEQDSGKVETTLNDYAAISAYRLKAEANLELAKELEQRERAEWARRAVPCPDGLLQAKKYQQAI